MSVAGVPAGLSLKEQLVLLNEYADSSNVGVVLSSMLYGIFVVQVYLYATSNATHPDSLALRSLVVWVFFLETTHTLLLWTYFLLNLQHSRFQPLRILDLPAQLALTYWLSGILGMTVQSFYGYRIWRLSGKFYLTVLPWAGSIARGVLATVALVISFESANIVDFMIQHSWALQSVFATSVGVDFINTISVCAVLYSRRGDQQITKRIVDKLIIWAVETGLVTTILAVAMLALILVERYSIIPGIIHVYPNMFTLSLMISLNSRDSMRQSLQTSRQMPATTSSRMASTIAFASKSPGPRRHDTLALRSLHHRPTEIVVHTETFQDSPLSPARDQESGIAIGQHPRHSQHRRKSVELDQAVEEWDRNSEKGGQAL